ncbi:MAG: polyhydroxyalkanoate synthesis repressor PhaR [Magnetococcales bacterium]|nr:polyhydroxyalkanoate synthesis repressor PhaR [Magnetococcales bacterium]
MKVASCSPSPPVGEGVGGEGDPFTLSELNWLATVVTSARVIKKYLNRRLYDTATSKFLTLDGVRQLVVDGDQIEVVDARTGEQLTRHVMLQIIGEQEEKQLPILSTELLTTMIRLYGDSHRREMSRFLQRSLELFLEQQDLFRRHTSLAPGSEPTMAVLSNLADMAQKNLELWRNWQVPFGNLYTEDEEEAAADPGHVDDRN